MAPTKVIVVGAGIAGPLLSVLLKRKGYEPILCERTDSLNTAGLSLCLQPNGMKVIAKAPGLLERIAPAGWAIDTIAQYSVLAADAGVLAENDVPRRARSALGVGLEGIKRKVVLGALIDHAEAKGVRVRWGHKLVALEQLADGVRVRFENGAEETASFVVGCDGLHSNTRTCLFGEATADFTGLVQCGGFSPVPERLQGKSLMMNLYDENAHMIAYQVNESEISWALTLRESEAKETWKPLDGDALSEFAKTAPFRDADFGGKELIGSVTHLVKYGLYDRPELKTWHKGRVLLIGDAAHPTSPHLGQGANQAFEDVDLLLELLEKHNPSAQPPSASTLETIFTELEAIRVPRSSALVKAARAQGNSRVVQGVDGCKARNDVIRESFKDPDALLEAMKNMYAGASALAIDSSTEK